MNEREDARTEIARAIQTARATRGPVIVIPPGIAKLPGGNEAFEDLAAETGRRLLLPSRDPVRAAAEARAAADQPGKPIIVRGDDEAFLKNLSEIARGRIRVE